MTEMEKCSSIRMLFIFGILYPRSLTVFKMEFENHLATKGVNRYGISTRKRHWDKRSAMILLNTEQPNICAICTNKYSREEETRPSLWSYIINITQQHVGDWNIADGLVQGPQCGSSPWTRKISLTSASIKSELRGIITPSPESQFQGPWQCSVKNYLFGQHILLLSLNNQC